MFTSLPTVPTPVDGGGRGGACEGDGGVGGCGLAQKIVKTAFIYPGARGGDRSLMELIRRRGFGGHHRGLLLADPK